MKYYLKTILEGSFPGSPDCEYVQITEDEDTEIFRRFKGRWKDTKELTEGTII